jgi:hypothetical protein
MRTPEAARDKESLLTRAHDSLIQHKLSTNKYIISYHSFWFLLRIGIECINYASQSIVLTEFSK